jgi:uncharacterized lipoprotein YddW (UPF0748 family)
MEKMPNFQQYNERKREMDDPKWMSQKNDLLLVYFKIFDYIKDLKPNEKVAFFTLGVKEYFFGMEYKLTPELDAFLDFFYFAKVHYDCEWVDTFENYCILVKK